MSEALTKATQLARKEKKRGTGRRGYSDELKALIREAAEEETTSAIATATGISYQTIRNFVGGKQRSKKSKKRARPKKRTKSATKTRGSNHGGVTIEVTVSLPSGTKLCYSDVGALRKDARVLSDAVEQFAG